MKLRCSFRTDVSRQRGWFNVDLLVALGLLAAVVLPLAFGMASERRLLQAEVQRASVVMLLDGELEVLLAGEWRRFNDGETVLSPRGLAAQKLPPVKCVLQKNGRHLRLEWRPDRLKGRPSVMKEAELP
jgi:hypothetical protein